MGREEGCSLSGGVVNQEFHVLAVDDCVVDRKFIEKLFKISSCKVTAVESGSRALQYLGLDGGDRSNNSVEYEEMKLNLIVTDYSMPGMTGFELLQKIKGSKTLREIPVVVMSSENVLARIDQCFEEGAEDFLVKPVKLSDVKRLRDFVMQRKTEPAEEKRTCCKRKSQQHNGEDDVNHHRDYSDSSFSSRSLDDFDPDRILVSEVSSPEPRSKRAKID